MPVLTLINNQNNWLLVSKAQYSQDYLRRYSPPHSWEESDQETYRSTMDIWPPHDVRTAWYDWNDFPFYVENRQVSILMIDGLPSSPGDFWDPLTDHGRWMSDKRRYDDLMDSSMPLGDRLLVLERGVNVGCEFIDNDDNYWLLTNCHAGRIPIAGEKINVDLATAGNQDRKIGSLVLMVSDTEHRPPGNARVHATVIACEPEDLVLTGDMMVALPDGHLRPSQPRGQLELMRKVSRP